MKLTIVTWYGKSDKKFCGDYYEISINDTETGELIKEYGDYYHDKGQEKVEGFLDGIEAVTGSRPEVIETNQNLDWE